MKISVDELNLIRTMKRRQMRRPISIKRPRKGATYKLQAHLVGVTITVTGVREEPLETMSRADARKEGFGTVRGAIEAYRAIYGDADRVLVIDFLLGKHEIGDEPIYLARVGGDYTTLKGRALPGEPEVVSVAGEVERARIAAIARRANPQYEALQRIYLDLETLKESLKSMKARSELRRAEHALKLLEDNLRPHDLQESVTSVAS